VGDYRFYIFVVDEFYYTTRIKIVKSIDGRSTVGQAYTAEEPDSIPQHIFIFSLS